MQRRKIIFPFVISFAFISGSSVGRAQGATPTFTVTANNLTMPSSGTGSIAFTLTSLNGWAGTVVMNCAPTNPPAGAIVPDCGYEGSGLQPVQDYPLAANGTATGSLSLVAEITPCNPCPASLQIQPRRQGVPGHRRPVSLALAGALVLALGLRRRAARWLTLTLLLACMLAGLAGIGACGNNGKTLTPGIYAYTITAYGTPTGMTLTQTETTTVSITVPSGIPTNLSSTNP